MGAVDIRDGCCAMVLLRLRCRVVYFDDRVFCRTCPFPHTLPSLPHSFRLEFLADSLHGHLSPEARVLSHTRRNSQGMCKKVMPQNLSLNLEIHQIEL